MMGLLATTGLLFGFYATRCSVIATYLVWRSREELSRLVQRTEALNERCEQIIGSIMSMCRIWVSNVEVIEGKEIPLYK